MGLDFRTTNTVWAGVCIETLYRVGLTNAVVCPGSRSTPLTLALAQCPQIEATPILDERSAAFFALGLAKQSGRAVVLVCTSGTAGANFYPAVIEAWVSRVPLLVFTADRPPELRDCNAGQAIDQQKLYGAFVNWYAEMAIPSPSLRQLAYVRQTMVAAWDRAHYPTPGPVHLNLPFRDPLAPVALEPVASAPMTSDSMALDSMASAPVALDLVGSTQTDPLLALAADFNSDQFFAGVQSVPTDRSKGAILSKKAPSLNKSYPTRLGQVMQMWQHCDRALIIVGPVQPANPHTYCQMIAALSQLLGCPVLAEGLSPVRNYASLNPYLISTYDMIVRDAQQAEHLAPEMVIRCGDMPTSKVLRQWLVTTDPLQWVIEPSDRNLDPTHGRTTHLRYSLDMLVAAFTAFLHDMGANGQPDTAQRPQVTVELPSLRGLEVAKIGPFTHAWLKAEQHVRHYVDQSFEQLDELCEPKVAWLLSRHLPEGTPLFISNSMPVRDVEWFWCPGDRHIQPYFNRGANGIDGIVSTALGLSHHNHSTVLLTGDLALLHDTNGLLIKPKLQGYLTIIVINNNGGGIFEMLPISQLDPPFEAFFATPQNIDLAQFCVTYGIEYQVIQTWSDLIQQIASLSAPSSAHSPVQSSEGDRQPGIQLLEVRCDRRQDTQWRRILFQAGSHVF